MVVKLLCNVGPVSTQLLGQDLNGDRHIGEDCKFFQHYYSIHKDG
jgi:hypothetical protein